MIGKEQAKEIELRRYETVKVFLKNPTISDSELAKILNDMGVKTSSSTVGRDLTGKWIEQDLGKETAEVITYNRKQNKANGKIIGGKNSQNEHGYKKDEEGHFIGSGKHKK